MVFEQGAETALRRRSYAARAQAAAAPADVALPTDVAVPADVAAPADMAAPAGWTHVGKPVGPRGVSDYHGGMRLARAPRRSVRLTTGAVAPFQP